MSEKNPDYRGSLNTGCFVMPVIGLGGLATVVTGTSLLMTKVLDQLGDDEPQEITLSHSGDSTPPSQVSTSKW